MREDKLNGKCLACVQYTLIVHVSPLLGKLLFLLPSLSHGCFLFGFDSQLNI
jgi:hypothetical protein